MSYSEYCSKLYEDRLALKKKKENARNAFRDQILQRQNTRHVKQLPQTTEFTQNTVENVFVMPTVLPTDVDQLKWLIFQNIEKINKDPENKKEYKENIATIKKHIQNISGRP